MLIHFIKTGQCVILFLSVLLSTTAYSFAPKGGAYSDEADAVGHASYCLDVKAELTFADVKECHFVQRDALTRKIHLGAAVWVKLSMTKSFINEGVPIAIHVAPHLIQQIEIFDGNTGVLVAPVAGTRFPFDPEVDTVGGYTFTIPAEVAASGTLYMRIATVGLPFVIVNVSRANRIDMEGLNQQIGLGLHLGVLSLMFFVSVGVYWASKSTVVGGFALLLLNLIFATLSGSGLLMKYVWGDYPTLNELFFNAMFYLRLGFWMLLGQAFLSHYAAPRWYRKSCYVIYALVLLMLCVSWWGDLTLNIGIFLLIIVTVPVVQVLGTYKTSNIDRTHQRLLMAGFIIGALLIWGTLLITIYPLGDPVLSIYLTRLGDYVNPLVLLLMVLSDHRQVTTLHAQTKKENDEIRLRLEFEQKIKNERKVLIDMLTHELKNPLASISMAIGSLSSSFTDVDVQQRRRLQNISHSIRNMDAVIERCHLMNQLDNNELSLVPNRFDISVVMNQILQRLDTQNRSRVLTTEINSFVTDIHLFKIIFSNLIENAFKYSAPGSLVEVNIQRRGDATASYLVISISNEIGAQGCPDLDHVFVRFYRHPLASDTTGSGLGLYLVKELTQLLKGSVRYRVEDGRVMFIVELPELSETSEQRSTDA